MNGVEIHDIHNKYGPFIIKVWNFKKNKTRVTNGCPLKNMFSRIQRLNKDYYYGTNGAVCI